MKHIIKSAPPHELHQWISSQPVENGQRINCSYKDMPGDVKRVVKEHLLREQGGLCCYTGMAIDTNNSHIEHFKSQHQCEKEGTHEDVDYNNLLGAYPGDKVKNCPFGAHARKDCDCELLVSPLRNDCEVRFRFDLLGHIRTTNENDGVAVETIKQLNLDHYQLVEFRREAIEATLFRKNALLSKAQLQRIAESYCQRNSEQTFRRFCFVITQAARNLLQKVERERRSKQFSRQQKRR